MPRRTTVVISHTDVAVALQQFIDNLGIVKRDALCLCLIVIDGLLWRRRWVLP